MSQQPRNDTDTGGDAVVQPVIHEVSGGTSFPTLTKTNYSDWAALMKVKLRLGAQDIVGGGRSRLC